MGTPLEEINLTLTTLAAQREGDCKELAAIHADVQRLLDPETGVYPQIQKVRDETWVQIEEVRGELKTVKIRVGFVVGTIVGAITLLGNWIIRKIT